MFSIDFLQADSVDFVRIKSAPFYHHSPLIPDRPGACEPAR
jgi:hypothetical protein